MNSNNLILQAKPISSSPVLNSVVDLNSFCDNAYTLAGQSPSTAFESLNAYVEASLHTVDWAVTGTRKAVQGAKYDVNIAAYERFLQVKATTQVSLMCGRCLQMMAFNLQVDRVLQVFQTDAAADEAALAPNADELPDPVVASRQFDLLTQIQEELLLEIPDNPTHPENEALCVLPIDDNQAPLSPFAALAVLKLNTK